MPQSNDYFLTCHHCCSQVAVTSKMAGESVACRCGDALVVPSLSELRRAAGQLAPKATFTDQLRLMRMSGELPWGTNCALSGLPTKHVQVFIVCANPAPTFEPDVWTKLLLRTVALLTFGFVALAGMIAATQPGPQDGAEFRFELRIAPGMAAEVKKLTAPQLRQLLSTVPIYAEILRAYPMASIRHATA